MDMVEFSETYSEQIEDYSNQYNVDYDTALEIVARDYSDILVISN